MKAVFALLFILMTVPAWSQDDPCKALLDKWGWKVEAETGSGPLEIPKKLTGEEVKLYRRLQQLSEEQNPRHKLFEGLQGLS